MSMKNRPSQVAALDDVHRLKNWMLN